MLALLLSASLALFLFIGFGSAVLHLLRVPAGAAEQALVGMAVVNTIAAWLSLFLPLGACALLAMTLACCALVFFMRKKMRPALALSRLRRSIVLYSLPFIVTAFLVSLAPPDNYDTGLYHLQSIKWIESYPAVPGLANLHGRFGFNPNVFTLFAITSLSGVFGQEIFSLNFILFTILIPYFIQRLCLLFRDEGLSGRFVFYGIVFGALLGCSADLSSPSPDFSATALTLFIFARTLDFTGEADGGRTSFRRCIPLLVLSIYVLTVKLSTAPVILLVFWMIRKQKPKMKTVLLLLALAGGIVLPWLLRNVILSGWLLYPFPSLDLFDVDWKVPVNRVMAEKEAVTGWARSSGEGYIRAAQMNVFEWVPHWWQQQTIPHRIWLSVAFFLPAVSFLARAIRRTKSCVFTTAVVLTSFSGVLFWVCTAPDFRFGKAFIVVAAASPLLYLKFSFRTFYNGALAFVVLILLLAGYYAKSNHVDAVETLAYKLKRQITRPPRTEAGVGFTACKLDTVTVYVPAKGDRCFDHCLPCTPYPGISLRLRGATIASGFTSVH